MLQIEIHSCSHDNELNKQYGECHMMILHGHEITEYLGDIIRLRLDVFGEYPYLYEGTAEEEFEYIEETYIKIPESVVCLVFDNERVIGAATGVPLNKTRTKVHLPLVKAGYNINDIFFLGELVLEKEYRGLKLGQQLYQSFENYVKNNTKCDTVAFYEVERSLNDPLKPSNYISRDSYWLKQGFFKHSELKTEGQWKIIGDKEETFHPMVYWLKSIGQIKIVTVDSPQQDVLRQKTEAIMPEEMSLAIEIGDKLNLALKPYMPAAGLAAPQIGINKSVFIFSYDRDPKNMEVVINPEFVPLEDTVLEGWEGCFSVLLSDNVRMLARLPRYERIRASYLNVKGESVERILEGFAAKVFQHEYDHLQGIECIDKKDAIVKSFDTKEEMMNFLADVKKEDSKRYTKPKD